MVNSGGVLIVEDDPLIALDIHQALSGFGYEVLGIVDSGEEAVERAKISRPECIFMDIGLKGKMDGVEAAEAIGESVGTPVVFLTALSDEATLQRAKLTDPYGFLI